MIDGSIVEANGPGSTDGISQSDIVHFDAYFESLSAFSRPASESSIAAPSSVRIDSANDNALIGEATGRDIGG